MGNKYRSPFIYDGRAEALTGAGAAAGDTFVVYDADADATKTITLTELATALTGAGALAAGWIPAPEAVAEWGGGDLYTLPAGQDGKHLFLQLDATDQTPAGLGIDFDNLADGESFWLSMLMIDENWAGGGAQGIVITAGGTIQLGFHGAGLTEPDTVDSVAGTLTNEGATLIGQFQRIGSVVAFHSAGSGFYTNASYPTGP